MADPLSITAGAIALVTFAAEVSSSIARLTSAQKAGWIADEIQLEISIYTKIMEEAGQIALTGTSELPESATLSLQLCNKHLLGIDAQIKSMTKSSRVYRASDQKNLETCVKYYRRSVKMLRDIVTDAMTQQLLQNSNAYFLGHSKIPRVNGNVAIRNVFDMTQETETTQQQIDTFIQQMEKMILSKHINGHVTIENEFSDRATAHNGLATDDILELRKSLRVLPQSGANHSTGNWWEFQAKILQTSQDVEDQTVVCVLIDTGSKENLLSLSVVERAGLQGKIQPPPETNLRGADGNFLVPIGLISITWSRNSQQSYQNDFLVMENVPYDMILGRSFIVAEGVWVFSDSVLVAADFSRLSDLSNDERLQMEINARRRDPQNQELSMRREINARAIREQRRAEKSASRMSAAASPGFLSPRTTTLSDQRTSSIRSSLLPTNGSSTPSYQRTPSAQSQAPSIVGPLDNGDAAQATQGDPALPQSTST